MGPTGRTQRRRARLGAALVFVLVLVGGCRADVGVTLEVDHDGGGRVRVEVVVDQEVSDRIDLPTVLRVDDLVQTGWRVTGPERRGEGGTVIEATKGFADPSGAARVMDEVSGPDGPFQRFRVTHSGGVFVSRASFAGTVDLTRGVEGFADPALIEALGGAESLQQLLGRPIDEAVGVRVTVRLPGRTETWTPSFGQATELDLAARRVSLVAVTGVVALVLVIAGLVSFLLSQRGRRAQHAA